MIKREQRFTNRRYQVHGFTIIELIIATTVFSVVLLLSTFALLQIGRTYYKGITASKTQEAARSIIDDISRGVQFSGGSVVPSIQPTSGSGGFCVDDKRYSYKLDQQLVDSAPNATVHQGNHALVVDDFLGCTGSTPAMNVDSPSGSYRELLNPNMRLNKLSLSPVTDQPKLYNINIRVVYGDDDILNPLRDSCGNFRAGAQFCAVSELSTVVQSRL